MPSHLDYGTGTPPHVPNVPGSFQSLMLLLEQVELEQPGFGAAGSQSWTWLPVHGPAEHTDAFCAPVRSMQHTCPEAQSAVPEHFSAES